MKLSVRSREEDAQMNVYTTFHRRHRQTRLIERNAKNVKDVVGVIRMLSEMSPSRVVTEMKFIRFHMS